MGLPELFIKACATIGLVALGNMSIVLNVILHIHIPPVIIEGFQILSYSGATAVAVITVYKYFKGK